MPITQENYNIDKINHGGAPDIIWCAKMIMRLKVDYIPNQQNVFLNLIRDLGIDPTLNENLFAIDFGDGFGVQYINNLNIDYQFRNNIKDTYIVTLYSSDKKIMYYPVDSYKDDIHFKVDSIVFNYNPDVKPTNRYSARFKRTGIDPIQNGVTPHNAEDIYVVYHDQDIVFGSKIDADELIYEIEITDPNTPIRLINPLSHPRFSWERLKHNVEITWGDGYVTKLYDYYLNTGRFNRYSSIILQHQYENVTIGQKMIIKIKSKEPLTPINCKITKIDGSFPIDNYLVKDSKFGNQIVGLFGECNHEDYPELSLLNVHRSTITSLGANLCKNYLNTSMKNHFKNFSKLTRVENGFFDSILNYCVDYSSCFENNTSLEYKPKNLLGYINNVVVDLNNMFKNTPNLTESLELCKSTSLITCNDIYSGSGIPRLYDKFLYECPNWKYANNICYNATNLANVDLNQFKYSNQLEEIANGFMNTKISIPFYLTDKVKLWNLNSTFKGISTLAELKVNMFTNMGSQAENDVNINSIFMDSGIQTGCIVPAEFFSSMKNVKSFTDTLESIMENFNFQGSDFPSQMFNGVFNANNPKLYTLLNPFKGVTFSKDNVEFLNKIFVGDNTKLVGIDGFIHSLNNNITYIRKDILNELPELQSTNRYFFNTRIDCIFPEEFLSAQSKLNSSISMFENVQYKYNHFPIDYLIRTQSNNINLTDFFKGSNVKTYKIVHWSSNKSLSVNAINLVDENTQTVPISFIVDNRILNPVVDIAYIKSSIRFLTITNANGTVTFKAINPSEDCIVNWGDGTTSTFNTTNTQITHTYSTKGVYWITYTSKYAIIPISMNNVNFMEIKGEFPYNSIPDSELINIELASVNYLDSVMHIANVHYTNKFNTTPAYINPHYLKYGVTLKRIDLFASNRRYNNLSILPSGFYKNCVGLNDFENTLNVVTPIIPDDIFPETLVNGTYTPNKLWIGKYQDGLTYRNKQHISNNLFKSYMNDTVSPFGTSYMVKPAGVNLKTFTTKVNDPLDEYLGFVINKDVTNLGLARLVNGSDTIGNIKIEIFAGETPTIRELNITSDSQLTNCIGNITIDNSVGFAYIRVYSKVPLWLTDISSIRELRGVIPPCILPSLSVKAPNLEWYSETLLCRLQNTSFRNFMSNLPNLRIIHRSTFSANTKASDFESCFENDTGLLEVPDYLIHSKDFDINCTKMFKGCTGVKYVYKPIDDSVRGRITVTDMFNGVKTVAFNSSNIDSQLLDRLWYIGSSGLGQHTSTLERPTVDEPTVYGFTPTLDASNPESCLNAVYFDENTLTENILTINNDFFKYAQSKIWLTPTTNRLPKSTIQTDKYAQVLKYLPNITMLHFLDEPWYFDDESDPKVFQTFNPKLFMYNERLSSIKNGFSQSEIITPINSTFMKFNTVINSLNSFAKNTWIRHKDDIGKSAILGYDHLGWAFLGAEGIRVPLEFTGFLNSDLECLVDSAYMFYSSRLNLETDHFSIGKCYPQNMQFMFGCDVDIQNERDRGITVTTNLIQNMYSHTSNTQIADLVDQYANIESLFDGNLHNETGTTLPDRVTSKAIIITNGLTNLFRNSYISPRMYNVNFMSDVVTEEDNVIIDGIFENTNIEKLPILPKEINSMKKAFKDCKHLVEKIPENYIDSSKKVDATEAFSGSSVVIEDKITTAKSMIVDDMLKDCVSTINETDIFESWNGFSKAITPDRRYAIDNPNVFVQTIDMYPTTNIYSLRTLTDVSETDRNKPFKVDFGDGTIKEVTLDDCEHHYAETGVYTITFYLDNVDFVPYTDYGRTLSISRLPISDCAYYKDQTFQLSTFFGGNIQMIEDDFFKNVKNLNIINHLQLCSGLLSLKVDPIAINEKMTSLRSLSYYYYDCNIKNPAPIPTSIKKQITSMMAFATGSNVNITEDYIRDFINVEEMALFGYQSKGYITPKLLQNKPRVNSIRGLLADSKMDITLDYNDFFEGVNNLTSAIMCFQNCTIKEFPTNIIKNTNLRNVDRLFASSNYSGNDIEFTIPEDFFPETIERTYKCFDGRTNLVDYHQKVFYNKPNLSNIAGTFKETGIKHIKQNTICGEIPFLDASELFYGTHPITIDDDIAVKWDTRRLIVNNILDYVTYNKPFEQIIGKSVKYTCEVNNYIYYKPQYSLQLDIDKPTTITLINTTNLQFPLHLDMHIDYGDGTSKHIESINSVHELAYLTRHAYQIGGNYTIKVMGETVIQLEIQK